MIINKILTSVLFETTLPHLVLLLHHSVQHYLPYIAIKDIMDKLLVFHGKLSIWATD